MLALIVLVRTVSWRTMVLIGMGLSYGIGTRLFVWEPSSPHLALYPSLPIHLSRSNHLGSCHLIQLITDSNGLWETRLTCGCAHPRFLGKYSTSFRFNATPTPKINEGRNTSTCISCLALKALNTSFAAHKPS